MTRTRSLDILRRLMAVDAALASRDGAHVGELADQFGVSLKSIRRDITMLAELVGPTISRQVTTTDNRVGRTRRHWYADRRRRLFVIRAV